MFKGAVRRVVVTGVGAVCPHGARLPVAWKNLLASQSGARTITEFETRDLPTNYACALPKQGEGAYNPDDWMDVKEQRKVDQFIVYAIAASAQAVEDAGLEDFSEQEKVRTGVMIGSGIGGIGGIYDASITVKDRGPRRVSPFFIPGCLINLASGQVSIKFGFKGPNHAVATACSTGTHSIGDAARMVALGDADVMLAGGAESPINRVAIAGFGNMRALSTSYKQTPARASRPYDKDRDGFVMGEGSAIVVLEDYDHAKARGAKIYGEVAGYGMSGDAHHISAVAEDGNGAMRCMQAALDGAGMSMADVDYINAHGTSTMADGIELSAVEKLAGDHASRLCMSSTKSSTGHLLGAAGALEAVFCLLAMRDNMLPPTLNLDECAFDTEIDLVPHKTKPRELNVALSNSFGFGGTNVSIIFSKI